jgi:hypothetical protein
VVGQVVLAAAGAVVAVAEGAQGWAGGGLIQGDADGEGCAALPLQVGAAEADEPAGHREMETELVRDSNVCCRKVHKR